MCKEAKILLAVNALFTFAMGLSSVFVNVFFWRETGNFKVIVIYNLMHYMIMPFTFFLGGMIAKKKNGIWSLRIGLLLYALFYVAILVIKIKTPAVIYGLGILFGAATGFYWLAYNTLSFDFTCMTNRDTFNGFNGSFAGVASAAAPIISGYIISRYTNFKGYNIVFIATLILFITLILISLIMKCKNYGSSLNIKKIFKRNSDDWSTFRKTTYLWGLRDSTIGFVINILIIQTTGSELSLGKLTLMASLLSAASFTLVQKIIKPPKRRLSIYIGTIGSLVAVMAVVLKVSYSTLLIFTIMDAFFLPFFLIQFSSSTCNIIERNREQDMRIEYIINKDIAINAGRTTSAVVLLLLLITIKNPSILKVYLVLIAIAPVVSGYFLRKLKSVLEGTTPDKPQDN